ncbi:hypothetical protein [Calycomorphotria hydatis]|uniref:Arylsulfotransferase (ASST) n=1 Tax=Calycomorphotria hydatis TaxID=2528027 RepID=A0A517T373_9PLAN|nr:hypothetical protein [Calycomorphotria hydatis]QDT62820.1 hypothetical protein V22_00180 [Calycomorphotria hydatis]
MSRSVFLAFTLIVAAAFAHAEEVSVSGIYPHLAMFNNEGECGTGAVVPWADRLWVVTYAPHEPKGSSDKLYEITPELEQIIRPESIGGTPANRMIHRESNQLFIGPYAIDAERNVRAIPYSTMFGRPTANARHLTDPANKIYYTTMEEGLYEVDVHSLDVKTLFYDEHLKGSPKSNLPGYHGKGTYSGYGRIIYANNGDHSREARLQPFVPSGALAEWNGQGEDWNLVLRKQFTEVTGPDGIYGNQNPNSGPVWAVGWDAKSLILMVLNDGEWTRYRLPKSSHSYDGAHGWNTEWPRIREIGEDDFLMTMHGAFWKFPADFTPDNSAGIQPRSNYLKVIGDFCRWQDRLVFGCDDTAHNEFLNKRKAKGEVAGPQSQSNLWFVEPEQLDDLGPVIGRGGPWVNDDVAAGEASDPFLFSGYDRRGLHLSHKGDQPVTIQLEVDRDGNNEWETLKSVELAANGYQWLELTEDASWVRLKSEQPLKEVTAWFQYANEDDRDSADQDLVAGLGSYKDEVAYGGIVRARDKNHRTLSYAAMRADDSGLQDIGYYELDEDLKLVRTNNAPAHSYTKQHAKIPQNVLTADAASVIFVADNGMRYRLPKGDANVEYNGPLGPHRVAREVATERDLFHAYGIFYELPARNAGDMPKVRPVATHNLRIQDFCSYRGLLILAGVDPNTESESEHIIRSDDGQAALWVGAVDDLWKFGKATCNGGPWKDTTVTPNEVSDPYLMTGFDHKQLTLSHDHEQPVAITVELDLTGHGDWVTYKTFDVEPGKELDYEFPKAFNAYWLRTKADKACRATAQLEYR